MKRRISVFFLSVYLLSSSPVSELFKLPVLISHFSEHQAKDKKISFLHFLAMHYANGHTHDSDYEKEMKLPFKTTTDNSFSVFYFNPPPSFIFKKFTYISQRKLSVYHRWNAYSFSYLNAIWQPPRTC